MKQIIIFLFSLNFLLISCASNKFEPFNDVETETFSFPPKGVVSTANKNKEMLSIMTFKRGTAVYVSKDSSMVKKGYYFATGKKIVQDTENVVYQFTGQGLPVWDETNYLLQYDVCKKELLLFEGDNDSYLTSLYRPKKLKNFSFSKKTSAIIDGEKTQQSLCYRGKTGNEIKVEFNEYYYSKQPKTYTYHISLFFEKEIPLPDSKKDSSYKEEITHDLSKSDIISYKNARIQVISATDKEIKYKVLQGF